MFPKTVESLVNELAKLPGIGPKTAQRLAFFLLKTPAAEAKKLAEAINAAKDTVVFCPICFNLTDQKTCQFCSNPERDKNRICIVEDAKDIIPIERTQDYKGLYHVLQGAISPIDGIGPEELRIKELIDRLKKGEIKEIIVATNPNIEGEATALYIAKLVKPLEIKTTRIASGLPVGGDLEYADEITLSRALEGRQEI
ncbi:MAG: recombination protein RecR [Actinobacteria bacterium]|nr:MAG: recombination protein RecR [Actinomycetota bacterium]